jgi:ferrous iron transport protein B
LAVLAFLAPAFFGRSAAWAMVALVGGNLVLLGLVGVTTNKLVFKGQRTAFIMEMPLYHRPNPRTIGSYVWRNTWTFVKKAGTIIVLVSAVVWALSTYPGPDPGDSVLGLVGRFFEPVGALMGLGDWRLGVALVSGFVAKENTVAALGVLFGSGAAAADTGLAAEVAAGLTPAGAAAFLVVLMTFLPCVATLAVIRQESRSWRWTAVSLGSMLVLSFALGVIVYQLGSLL